MKQLVFIDDSGDPGFIRGASSAKLVMAGAIFIDPEEATKLNNEISDLRRALGWHENHEFKFRKATKDVKLRFLRIVKSYHFEIYAVYIDKSNFLDTFRIADHKKLYNWTIKELLKTMPLDNAYVKIDGRADKDYKLKVTAYIRKEINKAKTYKIKRVETGDSVKDNLIQLADMVVGAINRSFQTGKTDARAYIDIIEDKIVEVKSLNLK